VWTTLRVEAVAVDYEYAWRTVAVRHGWKIYGLAPNVVVSPSRQMNRVRSQIAAQLKWPGEKRQFPWWWIGVVILIVVAMEHFAR
jgi:lysozyme family protein